MKYTQTERPPWCGQLEKEWPIGVEEIWTKQGVHLRECAWIDNGAVEKHGTDWCGGGMKENLCGGEQFEPSIFYDGPCAYLKPCWREKVRQRAEELHKESVAAYIKENPHCPGAVAADLGALRKR